MINLKYFLNDAWDPPVVPCFLWTYHLFTVCGSQNSVSTGKIKCLVDSHTAGYKDCLRLWSCSVVANLAWRHSFSWTNIFPWAYASHRQVCQHDGCFCEFKMHLASVKSSFVISLILYVFWCLFQQPCSPCSHNCPSEFSWIYKSKFWQRSTYRSMLFMILCVCVCMCVCVCVCVILLRKCWYFHWKYEKGFEVLLCSFILVNCIVSHDDLKSRSTNERATSVSQQCCTFLFVMFGFQGP